MKTIKYLWLILISLAWIGCKKETESSAGSKSILSIVFKAENNPSISADISGTITSDSVKFLLPSQADLSHLVPTITHDGLSINPPDKTVQDFSAPVTYTVTAQNGSTKNYVLSARTLSLTDTIDLAAGRWKLVKDSTSVINYYFNCRGTTYYPIPGVYIGIPGDFWDFKANNVIDRGTSSYTLSGGYQFLPGRLKTWDECTTNYAQILELNATNAVFYYVSTSPNGGHWGKTTWLKR